MSRLLAAVLAAGMLSACVPLAEREGVGTTLYSPETKENTAALELYMGHVCRQAGLPVVEHVNGPTCDDAGFGAAAWQDFVRAGMNDIDVRCDSYLAWLSNRKRSVAPVTKELNDIKAATQAVLTVTGVGTKPIEIVAQAFGLAVNTFTNVNSRLILEVNESTVQAIVLRRQTDFREGIAQKQIASRPDAIYVLRSYLRICMPFTIETDINTTIASIGRGDRNPEALVNAEAVGAAISAAAPVTATPTRVVLTPSAEALKLFASGTFQDRDVAAVQLAFCLAPGAVGPITLGGVAIFEDYKGTSSLVKKDGKITDQAEYQLAISGGPCDPTMFRNIFERENLASANRVESLLLVLNEVVPGVHVDSKLPLSSPLVRAKIAQANKQFGVVNVTGRQRAEDGLSDEVTPALYKALGIR